MGVFYVGYNPRNTVNGLLKIGVSEHNTPAKRLATLRQNENFKCLGWMRIDSKTKADLFLVESYVRFHLSKKYKMVGVDHFSYRIFTDKDKTAQALALEALALASMGCVNNNLNYEMGKKKYK